MKKKLRKPVRRLLEIITGFQGLLLISVNDFNVQGLKALTGLLFSFIVCVVVLEKYGGYEK